MKTYSIKESRWSPFSDRTRETIYTGTIPELTEIFSYTLMVGKSYEHERGNRKVNTEPKTIGSLIRSLNAAKDNASRGCSTTSYDLAD